MGTKILSAAVKLQAKPAVPWLWKMQEVDLLGLPLGSGSCAALGI